MRTFHFLDAVCLFMLATFILLETDASPKPSNTKLKNKGPTSSGNAKLNADPSPKTSVSNTKLENEPAAQKNPGLTVENQWNSKADACHADLTLSQPVQPSDPKLSKPKRFLVVKHKPGQSKNCSSVFAVQPIPKEGIFYYEVTILGKTGVVSIGLGPKQMPLAKEIGFEGYAYQSCGTFLNHEAPGCYYRCALTGISTFTGTGISISL
uniref:RBP-3 protein n=1 Tax=Globodera pallida TaxID=36090 RepID=C1KBN6_GLOPA|nr:RBP-3 protein [Globodera pallida]